MLKLSRQFDEGTAGAATRTVALSMVTLFLAACGGGDGVQIGTGEDPDPVVVDFPIAYIKSPLPTDDSLNQTRDLWHLYATAHKIHQPWSYYAVDFQLHQIG